MIGDLLYRLTAVSHVYIVFMMIIVLLVVVGGLTEFNDVFVS